MTSPLPRPRTTRAPRFVLVGYVVVLAVVLLWPRSALPETGVAVLTSAVRELGVDPRLATTGLVEVAANVAIMVPAALLARWSWPRGRWWQWTLGGLVLAVGVETVQALLLPERFPSAVDVGANTLGVAIGAALAGRGRDYRETSGR